MGSAFRGFTPQYCFTYPLCAWLTQKPLELTAAAIEITATSRLVARSGGPHSNDWTYEKDAKPNFAIESNCIANAKPLPGEQSRYYADVSTDYALIQKLITPFNFQTLSLAGLSNAGTAAAGEFIANPSRMNLVYNSIRGNAAGGKFPPNWEVLIRVAVRDGLPIETSVVAVRPGPLTKLRNQ